MLTEGIMIAFITGLFSVIGNAILNNKNMAVLQEKIDQLEKKQDKHNQLIERTYELEKDIDIAFERIKENREDINILFLLDLGVDLGASNSRIQ